MTKPLPNLLPDSMSHAAGMLMDAAANHQEAAERAIEDLRRVVQHLDPSVRQAVSQAAIQEFAKLQQQGQYAVQAWHAERQYLWWRVGVWGFALALTASTVVLGMSTLLDRAPARPAQPAPVVMTGLRGDPAVLAEIAKRGATVEVGLCGEARRVCVKVEPKAGSYGPKREFVMAAP